MEPLLKLTNTSADGHLAEWVDLLPQETLDLIERIGASDALAVDESFYPAREDIFSALKACAPSDVRVIVLGQDPYHEPGQAMGMSFSVREGTKYPPSLRNIFKELKSDLGADATTGDLTPWARQGVLLLNTVLTVPRGQANGHAKLGWLDVTSQILQSVMTLGNQLVVLCWGKQALSYTEHVPASTLSNVHVIASTHPSPLSASRSTKDLRSFLGSRPFSRANEVLQNNGARPVDWDVLAG